MAVAAAGRRADGDKHGVGALHGAAEIGGEAQPPGTQVAGDEILQPGLIDRHLALLHPLDALGILVDAGDADAKFGKAGAGNQAHIAGAHHGDTHRLGSYFFELRVDSRALCFSRIARAWPPSCGCASANARLASRNPALSPQSKRSPSNR